MDEKLNMFMVSANDLLTLTTAIRNVSWAIPLCWMANSIRNAVAWRFSLY